MRGKRKGPGIMKNCCNFLAVYDVLTLWWHKMKDKDITTARTQPRASFMPIWQAVVKIKSIALEQSVCD